MADSTTPSQSENAPDPVGEDIDGEYEVEETYDEVMQDNQDIIDSPDSSSDDGCTDQEKELVSLLLHIDTTDMPNLDEERDPYIERYYHLKEGHADHSRPFDDDARTEATKKFKKDLNQLVLDGRPVLPESVRTGRFAISPIDTGPKPPPLDPEIRRLLIDFCELHEQAILAAIMSNSRTKTKRIFLKHTPVEYMWDDDQNSPHKRNCEPLYVTFDSYRASFEPAAAAEYIMDYIRFEFDDDLPRFINDLTFVVVIVYLRLHQGHLESCGPECEHREEMGARMRAMHYYGCLEGQVARQGFSLAENLYEHVQVVVPVNTRRANVPIVMR
ncbi:hypothetical protein DFH27DRAFT_605438 [Peziza echinospora]|nr:hypothetical protein DFH27DRAFT_605438 [Peziza echinospora]